MEDNGKENNLQRKKRKLVIDLNKKPKEERQKKYYWPKIDDEKKKTPKKPKTPKPKTPKPSTSRPKNKNTNNVDHLISPQTPEQVSKQATPCSNNVGDGGLCGFKFGFLDDQSHVSKPETPMLVTPDPRRMYDKNEDRVTCKRVLSFDNADVISAGSKIIEFKNVYRRRVRSKCLSACLKLGLNFKPAMKRKRKLRPKISIKSLKKLQGFSNLEIDKDIINRIAVLRCKGTMLLPTKEDEKVVPESFECVLSLVSSSIKVSKKKRLMRKNKGVAGPWKESFAPLKSYCPALVPYNDKNTRKGDDNFVNSGGKPEPKPKKKRTYKRKSKHADYLTVLKNWNHESLGQYMESLVDKFSSMELYDNPKSLERWEVLFNDKKGDYVEELYEKIKWEEERTALLKRMYKFICVMTESQGSRDFVRWNGSVLDSVVGVFLTQNVSDVLSSNAYMELGSRYPIKATATEEPAKDVEPNSVTPNVVIEHPAEVEETAREEESRTKDFDDALNEMLASLSDLEMGKAKGKQAEAEMGKIDWEAIRVRFAGDEKQEGKPGTKDSVDWEAVRKAPVGHIAEAILGRGQHRIIAAKIQRTLNRILQDHGSLDLEWLREAPPQVAKAYILSFYGLGLKSVECLRLLTLHHHAFPVDVNIGRIAIRLGWVPIKPLPMGLHFHLLEKYPLENQIQKYLWPRLKHLDQKTLYKLHYHMITFGKVFCSKKRPNCAACPLKGECKYYASVATSRLALPSGPYRNRNMSKSKRALKGIINPFDIKRETSNYLSLPAPNYNSSIQILSSFFRGSEKCEPIVEMPSSPEPEPEIADIEDSFSDCVNNQVDNQEEEIEEINLSSEELKQTFRNFFEENNIPFGGNECSSQALVSLSPGVASMGLPKHMVVARLRTEHQVYELPDNHPLLKDLARRDDKDPLPYLLAVWVPVKLGKTGDPLKECEGGTEDPYSSYQDDNNNSPTVPGTLLIPSRTANNGSFALNGTYFQVNEVFVDDESCQNPINVPTALIWNLPKRTLYCGSSTTSIFRGLTWSEIRRCCRQGFICTRGYNRQTRAPKLLSTKFHSREKGKLSQYGDDDD